MSQTASLNNFGGRAVPDISSDADPNTGVLIYTGSKTPEAIGGTSVSSPTVMGLWARIEGANHNKLGLAANRLYRLYNKSNPATVVQTALGPEYVPAVDPVAVPGLRDVILGSNGLYTAKPGWDYTTGVGTPLAAQLSHQLSKSLSRDPSRHP